MYENIIIKVRANNISLSQTEIAGSIETLKLRAIRAITAVVRVDKSHFHWSVSLRRITGGSTVREGKLQESYKRKGRDMK